MSTLSTLPLLSSVDTFLIMMIEVFTLIYIYIENFMAETEITYLALPLKIKEEIVKLSEEEHRTIVNMTVKLIIEALEARNIAVTDS